MPSPSGPVGDVLSADVAADGAAAPDRSDPVDDPSDSDPDDGTRDSADRPQGAAGGASGAAGPDELGAFDDEITIRVPARSIYVAVLRTAIAGVAARCDFNVDEIEDLRIAVDEACGLLLHDAAPGAMLSCHFAARADSLVAAVSSQVVNPRMPNPTSFGWLVLSSLAGAVRAEIDGDTLTILLSRPRVTADS